MGLNKVPGCYCIKIHGSCYSVAGTPDIVGSYYGAFFAFEVKREGVKKPSDIQLYEMDCWKLSRAIVGVVHNLAEAKELLFAS